MARRESLYGPRSLTCVAVLKKNKLFIDPATKRTGRCGECRSCWRLFVHACKQVGVALPRARRNGAIAGFQFVYRSQDKPALELAAAQPLAA